MKKGDVLSNTPYNRVLGGLKKELPGLYQLCVGNLEDFHSLRIYRRGEADVLVVCKRFNAKGEIEVLFGSGYDFASALLSASSGYEERDWRLDKPFVER